MLIWLQVAGVMLINILLAMFGNAVVESPVSPEFRVHTLPAILLKQYILSATCACLLGTWCTADGKTLQQNGSGL
jgi:hypothetical protein